MIISQMGIIRNFQIIQANVHNVKTIVFISKDFLKGVNLFGDKEYIAKSVQLSFFEQYKVKLITPIRRSNQMGPNQWYSRQRKARKRIKKLISQFYDQFPNEE